MKTTRLIFWSAITYAVLLVLARGLFPSEATPTVSLAAIPLIVIVFIIARDLARRTTTPSPTLETLSQRGFKEDPVRFFASQIRVASKASDSYFENVVRSRLRELLISKVSLQTGLDPVIIRRTMSDSNRGADLLHDRELYRVLYGALPKTNYELMRMIEQAIEMIGGWKI